MTELEPLAGLFVNTVPLRATLSADMTFAEALGYVRDVAMDAFEHQDLPFDERADMTMELAEAIVYCALRADGTRVIATIPVHHTAAPGRTTPPADVCHGRHASTENPRREERTLDGVEGAVS